MRITFEEQGHVYTVNGDIATISVTELLGKHGLAPDYSGVDKAKLRDAASKGKAVHKDLENIFNEKDYTPVTEQGRQFAKWVAENVDCGVGEQLLGLEMDGWTLAGTADVMAFMKNGALTVSDHKNTSAFHREYVTWQVNLLDYMARRLSQTDGLIAENNVKTRPFHWAGATVFYCFHYDPKTGEMSVKELEKIPDEEIEKLLEAERNGEIYQRPALVVEPELQEQWLSAEKFLAEIENQRKQAEETAKACRAKLCELMEKQGVKSWECDGVKVTYVAPIDRLSVDSTKLKKNYPQVYTECQKLTKVKATVRITFRGEEE